MIETSTLIIVGIVLLVCCIGYILYNTFLSGGEEIVMIYTDTCSHCQNLKPIFLSAMDGCGVKYSMKNAHDNVDFCKTNGIDRVPLILKMKGGTIRKRYTGPNTEEAIKKFALT